MSDKVGQMTRFSPRFRSVIDCSCNGGDLEGIGGIGNDNLAGSVYMANRKFENQMAARGLLVKAVRKVLCKFIFFHSITEGITGE